MVWRKKTGRMKPCQKCGTEFYCHPCKDVGGPFHENKYCSKACYHAVLKEDKTLDIFWSKVEKTATCWLFKGALSFEGYGRFNEKWNKRQYQAHRYSWTQLKGEIPKGKLLLHHCDIRNCVNPEHLYVGTRKDNIRDCIARGRYHHRYTPVEELLWPTLSRRIKS